MACENCKKVKLNNCDDCDFVVSTDCVEYKGDKLSWETNIKNGESRTVSEIFESLDVSLGCKDRIAKVVQDDYTIIEEDICNILLLDVDLVQGDSPKIITLPSNDEAFINKVLVIKDISTSENISGEVWNFDSSVLYDFRDNLSTTSFNTLANSLHRVLYLAYIQLDGINYSWVAISPNTDLKVIRLTSSQLTFTNGWTDSFDNLVVAKHGNRVQLEGTITAGDAAENAFRLPTGFRPTQDMVFIVFYDASPWFAVVNVLSTGHVQPQVPGTVSPGNPVNDNIYLHPITFFTQ